MAKDNTSLSHEAALQTFAGKNQSKQAANIKPDQPADSKIPLDPSQADLLENALQNEELMQAQITDRKRAEDALKESELKFRNAFQFSAIGMALVSPEGKWIKVNSKVCDLVGYAEKELMAKTFQDITHPDDLNIDLHFVSQMLTGEIETYTMEKRYFHKHGNIVWVFLAVSLVRDSSGSPVYFVSQIEDITERKRAEEKVKVLLMEKELLLKEIHHGIKNNMNLIMDLLSSQAQKVSGLAAAALKDAIDRLGKMGMLYYKLYQTERTTVMPLRDYLRTLAEDIVAVFHTDVKIELIVHGKNFEVGAKILSILGIILNELLVNILKYAFVGRPDGTIIVSTALKEKHATIIVEDDGVGIPGSIDVGSSSGFGLRLVDLLMKQLDGTIRIERENGTKFILDFEL